MIKNRLVPYLFVLLVKESIRVLHDTHTNNHVHATITCTLQSRTRYNHVPWPAGVCKVRVRGEVADFRTSTASACVRPSMEISLTFTMCSPFLSGDLMSTIFLMYIPQVGLSIVAPPAIVIPIPVWKR